MTPIERVTADYEGTSLTIGPHPMAYKRADLALRGVMRARRLEACEGRAPRAGGRRGDYAAAAGHREGVRVPHAGG